MSRGDQSFDDVPSARALVQLRRLQREHLEIAKRMELARSFDDSFDIPYLGGISRDGRVVFFDKRLPSERKGIPLRKLVALHEVIEWAIKPWAQSYEARHHMATAGEDWFAEHELGVKPSEYRAALRPFYAPIEHEDIERVPRELDLSPYSGELRRLLSDLQKGKVSKKSVNYERGISERECSLCSMFRAPSACTLVAGKIAPSAVCRRFERRAGARA